MTEIMLEEDDIDEVKESAEEILNATDRIRKITSDLSIYSRDAKTSKYLPLDINEAIEKSLSMAKFSKKFRNIDLKLDLRNVPQMEGNSGELQQVFVNLFTNAIDAMGEKGGLGIKTLYNADLIQIEVNDTGKGISPDNLNKIFDPFFTTKEAGKGTGLGLHVIHQIVEKHKGTIKVDSEVGKGTTFTILFKPTTDMVEEPN